MMEEDAVCRENHRELWVKSEDDNHSTKTAAGTGLEPAPINHSTGLLAEQLYHWASQLPIKSNQIKFIKSRSTWWSLTLPQ